MSDSVYPAHLQHVSPLRWEHINLTGDYTWYGNKRVSKGGFRPLRPPRNPLPRSLAYVNFPFLICPIFTTDTVESEADSSRRGTRSFRGQLNAISAGVGSSPSF